jgi:hypothetical protein
MNIQMSKHKDFILSPITHILHEAASASYAIGSGIETYPLSEHIFQSAFLRMTGSQEQKMKCICWELATNDYEYRYYRYTQNTLGECSSYADKKSVYKDLINCIKKYDLSSGEISSLEKSIIRQETVDELKAICSNSNLSTWAQSGFDDFVTNQRDLIKDIHFAVEDRLFENVLQDKYALLYKHRNRCAHNTLSYQENLPTLTELLNVDNRYDNYIIRFALLILLDKIFIVLYKKHLAVLEEH